MVMTYTNINQSSKPKSQSRLTCCPLILVLLVLMSMLVDAASFSINQKYFKYTYSPFTSSKNHITKLSLQRDITEIKRKKRNLILQEPENVAEESTSFISSVNTTTTTTSTSSLSTSSDSSNTNKYSIVILILCFFIAALSALDRVAMSIAVLPLSSEYHLTETIKGQISSAFSFGYALSIIPVGLIVATASPRIIMALGVFLWSVGTILTPWATNYISSSSTMLDSAASTADLFLFTGVLPILIMRAIIGGAEAIVLPTIQRFLANWIPAGQKSVAIATIFAGFQTGTILAYIISPLVIDSFGGWREMFYTYGGIGIVALGPWLLFAKDSPDTDSSSGTITIPKDIDMDTLDDSEAVECKITITDIPTDDKSFLLDCSTDATVELSPFQENLNTNVEMNTAKDKMMDIIESAPWKKFLTSPGVYAMTIAHAANNWGLYNNLSWTPTFYAEQYGLNVKESALLSLIPSVAGAFGGYFSAIVADSLIRRQTNAAVTANGTAMIDTTNIRKVFQGIALLGPSICLALLSSRIPESPSTAQLLLTGTVGLQAFNAAGYGAATQEKAGEKWSGLLYSITTLPGVLFGTMGVYLTGQILDSTDNNWSLVFGCNAGIDVVGALAFLLLYDAKREFD